MDNEKLKHLIGVLNRHLNDINAISIYAGGHTFRGFVHTVSSHTVVLRAFGDFGETFTEITLESIIAICA